MPSQLSASYIRRSFQLLGELVPDGDFPNTTFDHASDIVYEWAKCKFSRIFFNLPKKKETFDDKRDTNEIGLIYEPQSQRFILRISHPDKSVAGRSWITDVYLRQHENICTFAVRLSVSSLYTCTENVPFSRPNFISSVINDIGVSDCIPLINRANPISTQKEADTFIALLENPKRRLPAILVTPCNRNENAIFGQTMVDADQIARDVLGIAHVFQIAPEISDYLNDRLGKQWSAYNGAIRTYYPGLSLSDADYYKHPLLIQQRILQYKWGDDIGAYACMRGIEEYVQNYLLARRFPWDENEVEFYFNAYQNLLSAQSKQSEQSHAQTIESYEKQIKYLKEQDEEDKALAESYAQDNDELKEENERQRQIIGQLKAQLSALKHQLQCAGGEISTSEIPEDGTYQTMAEWVEMSYPGQITLHSRAIRSLKDAQFEDVQLVFKCLRLLATEYYDYCTVQIDYEAFTEACKAVAPGLEERPAITDTAAGMQGDDYYVQYHGKRKKLERHLAKGNSKDPRYCLRIYFFWDDEDQTIVVGDLPRHLDTNAT